MFTTKTARRVTILVDAALKTTILDKVVELGAKGYNFVECKGGKGLHAISGDPHSGDNLLRIEVICALDVGAAILDYIHTAKLGAYSQYALSAYADTVEVDRRDESLSS
jgi:hypothetical protein